MKKKYLILVAALSFGLAGCSLRTDCEKAVGHIMKVIATDSAISEEERKAMTTFKSRKIILDQCYENFRPEGGIDCVLKTTSLKQINACRDKMKIK